MTGLRLTIGGGADGSRRAERDATLDDPSPEQVAELVQEVADGDCLFFVAERRGAGTDPPADEVYLQLTLEAAVLTVEHREGGQDAHFVAAAPEAEMVTRVLLDWARQGSWWRAALPWAPLVLPAPKPVRRRWFSRSRDGRT